jgi:uncharacterized protein (DUF3820 family)
MADETGAWQERLGRPNQQIRPVSVVAGPASSYRLPFGKHKGSPVNTLPDDYLQWLSTRDLREPLGSVVQRELHARGQKLAIQTMDERLQEARRQGFFLVQEGREPEVRAYQQWCVETGAPCVCVAMGTEAATVAISYVGVNVSLSLLPHLVQTLTERWPSYAPQLLSPASIVLLGVPRSSMMEVMPELITMLHTKDAASPAQEGSGANLEW